MLYKYDYRFTKITDTFYVFRDGPLNIYIFANTMYWNRHGKLERASEQEVTNYFDLH